MMRSQRFELLADIATRIGARVTRTGNGAFVVLHQGERHSLGSLRALEAWVRALIAGGAR